MNNRRNKNCFKRAIQKTAEATGDLIDNKTADKITGVSKKSKKPQNNQNNESEAPKERYISPEKRHKLLMNEG